LQQIAIEKVLEHERQLIEEEESRHVEPNGKDDVSLWKNWIQWNTTFKGKDPKVRKNHGHQRGILYYFTDFFSFCR
jgi:hypothetical protein